MKYLLLIYADERAYEAMSEDERREMYAAYDELMKDVGAGGHLLGGEELAPTSSATSVQVRGGERLVTDGPFAETKEQLGGYFLIDVDGPRRRDRHRRTDPERARRHDRGAPARRRMTTVAEVVDRAYRDDTGRAVATLIRVTHDFDLAEEAWQEACEQALRTWPQRGVPRDPTAWLFTAARNRAIDRLRRERVGREKTAAALQIAELEAMGDDMHEIPDDRLRLLFTCCHPSLAPDARVALTLRTVAGLTDAGDRPRVPRARADARPAADPGEAQDPRRGDPVRRAAARGAARSDWTACRTVIYLVFNEGYEATEGELIRTDLCDEAIRLARLLDHLIPDEAEVRGLLALLLLQHARRAARTDAVRRPRHARRSGSVPVGPRR